jgi:hypothetical protein
VAVREDDGDGFDVAMKGDRAGTTLVAEVPAA